MDLLDVTVGLIVFSFPIIWAPGPGNLACAAAGAHFRPAQMVRFIVGLELMVFGPTLAIMVGFGKVMSRHETLLTTLQAVGVVVVFALAAFMWTHPPSIEDDTQESPQRVPGFADAVILQATNLKGAFILVVAFAKVIGSDQSLDRAIVLASAVTAVSLSGHCAWLLMGRRLALRFQSPAARKRQGRLYAAMLAGVGLWLLFSAF